MRRPTIFWLAPLVLLLAAGVDSAQGQYRLEAVAGQPFGVGRLKVDLPAGLYPEGLGAAGIQVSERNGRVHYPVVRVVATPDVVKDILGRTQRPLGRLLGELFDRPPKVEILFLFRGDAPLELTLVSGRLDAFLATPSTNAPADHRRLLQRWWREYTDTPGFLENKDDYPPIVHNYLQSMLAWRLGLPAAEDDELSWPARFEQQLGMTMSTESIRVGIQRDQFLRSVQPSAASQGLPEPFPIPQAEFPLTPDDVQIEPLAMSVPRECFYIRFGSFGNFLWLQDTLGKWGGDVQNLLALRGLDTGMKQRMERQLVVKQTALAKLLGPTIIADVGVIGTDTFFQDGGSYGLLFHARNNLLLGADFHKNRAACIAGNDDVTEQTVQIAGREVSFLSSADGSVRSYYVVEGHFHLVTSCRKLVERFLETAADNTRSLGASHGFRHARTVMPLDRDDTIFVYLSDDFFRNAVSPQYRLETVRRMEAMADIELLQLALLAAVAEGAPGGSIEELIEGHFLPPGFGVRDDGSRTMLAEGAVWDSLRGQRGRFTPVPDVEVTTVSAREAEAYRRFADFYRANWGRLDPIVAAMKRYPLDEQRERVVIDAQMTPFSGETFEKMNRKLGPPDAMRLAPVPGDVASFELILHDQRIFGGLRDVGPRRNPTTGGILLSGILRNFFVGYLGTTGEMGMLGIFSAAVSIPPDSAGHATDRIGPWRRQWDEYTLFSFQPEVLEFVCPLLHYEEAQREAQIRLRVDGLAAARITPLVNNLAYARTRETSRGNLRLMNQLATQLHVPGEQCRATAELLLDAKLICPLGGEYVYQPLSDRHGTWTSTAVVGAGDGGLFSSTAPEGFLAPPLRWFRGLEADVRVTAQSLTAHAEVVMQMPPGT